MSNKKRIPDLVIEDAFIIPGLRNFSGREQKFSPAGERTFAIAITAEDAVQLSDAGWNIKTLKARTEDEDDVHFLSVKVSFAVIPPQIFLITDGGHVPLTEENINLLDTANISQADAVINPYYWNLNGKEGYKAYLKKLYVTIEEDRFMAKYGF